MYRQVLLDGQPKFLENHYVFPDGRQAWYDVRAFKVRPGVAVLFRDVTEHRAMVEGLKKGEVESRIAGIQAGLAKRPAAFPQVILTSSRDDRGIPELRAAIAKLLIERGA